MTNILIIIAFTLIVYFRTIKNNLILDDIPWYRHRREDESLKVTNLKMLFKRITDDLYSGGTFNWLMKNASTKTKEEQEKTLTKTVKIDHVFAIFLNALTGILIYLAFGGNNISFWSAMMWVANPINNQLTIWLNGRRFIINIILVMLMLILPYGILLYPLTGLFQVTAIFSPILLGNPWYLLAIPLALIVGWKEINEKIIHRLGFLVDEDRRKFTPKRLFIIVKDYGHYFFKMIIPGTCAFNYPMRHAWGVTEKGNKDAYSFNYDFFKGICALFISILGVILMPHNLTAMVIFTILATLQWCSIIAVVQDLTDRYSSLPCVFMMFFLSYLVNTYCGQYALPIMSGILVYYTAMLFDVMKMYKSMPAYWEYSRFHYPTIPVPRKFEIGHYLKTDVNKAWMLAKEGLQINPNEFIYLQQAAIAHRIIGDKVAAKVFCEEAMKNYYIGQKEKMEPECKMFIENLNMPIQAQTNGIVFESRQARRAREREEEKAKLKGKIG